MRRIRLAKVTVNIAVGKSGEPLEKAKKLLQQITGQQPCSRKAKKTVKDFGIRRGEPIACAVTLRNEAAKNFLKRALDAVENKLKASAFDENGNFSFGIREHIEIPGTKYVPELGIVGMTVSSSLERPGYRVKRRSIRPAKVGKKHAVTKEEAIQFAGRELGVEVVGN